RSLAARRKRLLEERRGGLRGSVRERLCGRISRLAPIGSGRGCWRCRLRRGLAVRWRVDGRAQRRRDLGRWLALGRWAVLCIWSGLGRSKRHGSAGWWGCGNTAEPGEHAPEQAPTRFAERIGRRGVALGLGC